MEKNNSQNARGFTEVAMKVNKARAASSLKNREIRFLSAAVCLGLLPTSCPYAYIAAGVSVMSATISASNALKNILYSNAMKHKLKRIAKLVKKECGINIRPEYNYDTRQAGFVLCDLSGRIPITSFLTSDNISEYLNDEQCAIINRIIDEEFARTNSIRGKGENYKTLREYKYREFKKIDLDNITSAFDHIGGVLSDKELRSLNNGRDIYRIEYNRFMKNHKNEELWVFSAHLLSYLNGLTYMSDDEKRTVLQEFETHFDKYGKEGKD
ncbi:MAG: hypothetical protein K2G03_06805, partial [Bacilli bacterium]|nr:hypothetical protein [Bacilli bacterium]